MDSHNVPTTTTCALKVKIKCCTTCPEKAIKKLQKMDGVDYVSYDAEKGMLRVSGNDSIEPMVLINKFAEWGKRAELYSFKKDQVRCNSYSSKMKIQDQELDDDDTSDSDHDNDHGVYFDLHATNKHNGRNISWQHQSVVKNNSPPSKEETPVVNKQSTKEKSKRFFSFGGLFGKKEKEARKIIDVKNDATTGKWHFPQTSSMPGYRAPGPAPFHGERPHYMNQYPTMMSPGLIQPPLGYSHGYGSMMPQPLLPPPPYSSFQSRPPPRLNPMIHYTDYSDNYYSYR
ncbi:hypothetical protein ACOSQ3_019219 [Xanthoceras sorbifolium]